MILATNHCSLEIGETAGLFFVYRGAHDAVRLPVGRPVFSIDGRCITATRAGEAFHERVLSNGVRETRFSCPLPDLPDVVLTLVVQMPPDNPMVRFR